MKKIINQITIGFSILFLIVLMMIAFPEYKDETVKVSNNIEEKSIGEQLLLIDLFSTN